MFKTEKITCPKGCCTLKTIPYESFRGLVFRTRRKRKAGVYIKDCSSNKILLVQSRGNFWGPPKGTVQYGESDRLCAVREVKEETGLDISMDDFGKSTNIYNSAIYFFLDMKECEVDIQEHLIDNDANGIGWINIECLQECVRNTTISLNKHCKIVLERFENITF